MRGVSDTSFAPEAKLTRAMFVRVLAELSDEPFGKYYHTCFTDVPLYEWYTAATTWAYENKIVSGTGNGKFSPHKAITREEACVMISKYLQAYGVKINKNTNVLNNYRDSDKISSWAREGVAAAINSGIVSGVSYNTMNPKGIINRASCARLAMLTDVLYPDAKREEYKPWYN